MHDEPRDASIQDFEAFWPHFLRSHQSPIVRWCHVAALGCGIAAVSSVRRGRVGRALLLGGATAALAVVSHVAVEGKGPENLGRPLWAGRAFLRLCMRTISGRIHADLEALEAGSTASEHH